MSRKKLPTTWYEKRSSALFFFVVALGVAYLFGSLAINSGSLQQYFLVVVAVVYALNRLGHVVLPWRGN